MYYLIDFNPKNTRATAHATAGQASEAAKGTAFEVVVSTAEELAKRSMGELVELFNVLRGKDVAEVRKYKNKLAGATRCMKLLKEKVTPKAARAPKADTAKAFKKLPIKVAVRTMLESTEGATPAEVAEIVGCTVAQVKTAIGNLRRVVEIVREGDLYHVRKK